MMHVVMFSGGVCSWAAAKRVVEKYGTESTILLFADTRMEDDDLYRFLDEAADNVGAPLVKIADGRNPWEVMQDRKIIANSRIDPCSAVLKRDLIAKWRNENCSPETTTIYLGLDWTEVNRLNRVQKYVAPWHYESPMQDPPYLSKPQMFKWLAREGIELPRLYKLGFHHNNCGGFCVKAGQAQFHRLLITMPERYQYHEQQEEEMRKLVGNHSILTEHRDGMKRTLTLREFRERIERQESFDQYDWGGCGCALPA